MVSSVPSEEQHVGRTHNEASLDVLYGVQFNDLNERFYRRLDGIFSITTILGGSAVFAAFLAHAPVLSGGIGVLIAIVAYLDREVRPAQKAVQCALHRDKFGDLSTRMADLELKELDRELRLLQAKAPPTINALAMPAYTANLQSNGYELAADLRQQPLLSRAAMWLA